MRRRLTPNDNLIQRRGISRDSRAFLDLSLSFFLFLLQPVSLFSLASYVPFLDLEFGLKKHDSPGRRDTRGKRLSKAGINYLSFLSRLCPVSRAPGLAGAREGAGVKPRPRRAKRTRISMHPMFFSMFYSNNCVNNSVLLISEDP